MGEDLRRSQGKGAWEAEDLVSEGEEKERKAERREPEEKLTFPPESRYLQPTGFSKLSLRQPSKRSRQVSAM